MAGWRAKGLGREHQAQLALLQARLLAARGERGRAHDAYVATLGPATASQSPPLVLEAKLGAAETAGDRKALRAVLADAQRLGHTVLELHAAEASARAEIAAGSAMGAVGVLQEALQRARGAGSWGRAWALHALLAQAYERERQPQRVAEQLALARQEAARVEQGAPPEQRGRFAALPPVRELRQSPG